MDVRKCETCKHWRLDLGTNRRICLGALSDEYGDYTAETHKCMAWEQAEKRRQDDTGDR